MGFICNKLVPLIIIQLALLWFNFGGEKTKNEDENNGYEFCHVDFIRTTELHGYKSEAHNVTTPDGYTLTLFRVYSNAIVVNASIERPVIFLQHCVAASSYIFIVVGPDRSIVYSLVDAGYDVWLSNLRGNVYGRRHDKLSPEDSEFWNYSLDEYSNIDLPLNIDYILETTKQPKLTYIGHSLGTTIILMLLSAQPEYNEKLDTAVLLGPACFLTSENSVRNALMNIGQWIKLFGPNGLFDVAPPNIITPFLKSLIDNLCTFNSITLDMCYSFYNRLLGGNGKQFQIEKYRHIFCHFPAGISARVYFHYVQLMQNGKLQRYDYEDEVLNVQKYGQKNPPVYDVMNITTPMMIFHSPNDPLSTEDDVNIFISKLSTDTPVFYKIDKLQEFNHLDLIFGKDSKRLIYNKLLKFLSKMHNLKYPKLLFEI